MCSQAFFVERLLRAVGALLVGLALLLMMPSEAFAQLDLTTVGPEPADPVVVGAAVSTESAGKPETFDEFLDDTVRSPYPYAYASQVRSSIR